MLQNFIIQIDYSLTNNFVKLPSKWLGIFVEQKKNFPLFFEIVGGILPNMMVSVLEFTAENDCIHLSPIFCEYHGLYENDIIEVHLQEGPPVADFCQIEPLEESFFEIEDCKEFLENQLSQLSILFTNQHVLLEHEDKEILIRISEIKKDESILNCTSIIERELEVDILNSFLERRLLQQRQLKEEEERLRNDRQKESFERQQMQKEDVNQTYRGCRLSSTSTVSPEEMRRKRLERFKNKK